MKKQPTGMPKFRSKKPLQLSRHQDPGYVVGGRVWLAKDGELYMGWGRAILLERIEQYGSIAAAARSMQLGYRNAWLWVRAMNRLAPAPLVEKTAGGPGGRHSRLTGEGYKALREYKELRTRFQDFLSAEKE
jgi:molybdate transport system regulatory protein